MLENLPQDVLVNYLIRFSLESAALLVFLYMLGKRFGLLADIRGLAGSRQAVWPARIVIGVFALWIFAQCADRLQYHFPQKLSFFPFARFAMYQTGTALPHVDSYSFYLRYGGELREYNPTVEFSAIGLPSISTRFRVIAEKLISPKRAANDWARMQLDLFSNSFIRSETMHGRPRPDGVIFLVRRFDVSNGFDTADVAELARYEY